MREARVEHIGDATLYLGDCLEILPTLGKVDAVITDPPYGIGADKNLRANKQNGHSAVPSRDYGKGNWDDEPAKQTTLDLFVSIASVSIIWGGNYYSFPPQSCWLVWDKDNGNNGYADCELAWTNMDRAVRKYRHRWQGMLQENMKNKEERVHPTQKPIPLMAWCIELSGCETILDPFMGSGTTGVAALRLGRKFIGIEIDEKYFDIACKRIDSEVRQGNLFTPPKGKPKQETLI